MELVSSTQKGVMTKENLQVLEQAGIIPPNTPPAQVEVFANFCREKNLSPFSKEVYLLGYFSKKDNKVIYSNIVGIDGYRKRASQTGEHAGTDDVKFDLQPNGAFFTAAQLKGNKNFPHSATVTVYRIVKGVKCSFTHTALFAEFTTGKQKWLSMPFQMIAKVAESFALRKGFSDVLSGFSISEEAGAFQDAQPEEATPREVLEQENVMDELVEEMESYTAKDKVPMIEYFKKLKKGNDFARLKEMVGLIRVRKLVMSLVEGYGGTDKDVLMADVKKAWISEASLKIISEKLNPKADA